ncbi:MAG: NADH-quinone oxidoreductase subunit NuoK [bacterium]
MTITLHHYLVVAALLFSLGLISCIARKNAIGILIGIELMLNAVNLNFIAFSRYSDTGIGGQIFAVFIIILAACEAAVALAIIINLFYNFGTIIVDKADRLQR